jgi:lysozyme
VTAEARAQLRTQLMTDEGFVPHAYQDSRGYWTIGHGICIDARTGGGLTPQESARLLDNRIGTAIRDLSQRCPWFDPLDDVRQVVIANMAYNLGVGGVAGFRKMIAALERADYRAAAREMVLSRWSVQTGARANRLATMMASGQWVTP